MNDAFLSFSLSVCLSVWMSGCLDVCLNVIHQFSEYASNMCCYIENKFIIILTITLLSSEKRLQENQPNGKAENADITR